MSEGARRLLLEALYIPVWGGTNTLAQALKHLAETTSEEEAAKQRPKLQVYAISYQNDTGLWMRTKFLEVSYIVSAHGWNPYGQPS